MEDDREGHVDRLMRVPTACTVDAPSVLSGCFHCSVK